jgi:23S rRNA (guanosine2251-2'-O)-methyltransferase
VFVSGLKGRPAGRPWPQQRRYDRPQTSGAELELELSGGRLVVGIQPVRECVRVHRGAIERLVLTASDSPTLAALERFATYQGVSRIERLPRGDVDRLAHGAQHQGAIAVAPALVLTAWEDVVVRPQLLAIALDQVQDPQNFGAVIRSAVATGGAAVLWGEHASAPLGAATFRASAGAIEHATLSRVPALKDALRLAQESGVRVVGLAARAERLLSELDLTGPTVIVLGSEGSGLQPAVRRCCSELAAIVRPKVVDSLNASVAAAIALYEAEKQRSIKELQPVS